MEIPENEYKQVHVKCLHALLAERPKKESALLSEIVTIEQFGKVLAWFGPLQMSQSQESRLTETSPFFDRVKNNK